MKQKLYGVFSNIDDAKTAIGRIKKENFNRADLTVIFFEGSNQEPNSLKHDNTMEFAAESFLENPQSNSPLVWPGVKKENLSGIGEVQIGTSHGNPKPGEANQLGMGGLTGEDLGIIGPEVRANKIVTIVETDPELIPKLRLILESNGAEIINNQV